MCNNKRGHSSISLLFQLVNGSLYLSFVLFVESAGCLVENKHAWLLYNRTSEGKPLFLTTGELTTTGSDLRVDSVWVLGHESPSVSFLECCLNFCISGVWFAHEDVLFNSRVEENRLLAYVANLLTIVAEIQVL